MKHADLTRIAQVLKPPPEMGMRKLRTLVVDDTIDAAESLSTFLDMRGHIARMAHDGQDALVLVQDFRPDIVFLDIGLPSLDGYAVAQAIRRMIGMENVLLVALTGWGADSDRAQTLNAGFDHHLVKPALTDTIEAILRGVAERTR